MVRLVQLAIYDTLSKIMVDQSKWLKTKWEPSPQEG